MKNKFGFTLVELMAVVIIIALLAGLSVGYYKKAAEQARFSEGLSIAAVISEAVNRSYQDDQLAGETPTKQPKWESLDISFRDKGLCRSGSDYCKRFEYFEVSIDENGFTQATRIDKNTGSPDSLDDWEKYSIRINPRFAAANPEQISCVVPNAEARAFCQSMGYTTCNASDVCVKS